MSTRSTRSRPWATRPGGGSSSESTSTMSPVTPSAGVGMSVPTPADGVTGDIVEVDSLDDPPPGLVAQGLERVERVDIVEVDSLDALKTLGDKARGRIVLFSHETTAGREMGGYGATSPLRVKGPSEAARLGAVAALVRSLGTLRARLPHTGTLVY